MVKKRNRLLFVLSILNNLFKRAADPFGLVSLPYKQIYGYSPYGNNKGNFDRAVGRSIKTKDIEKIEKNRQTYFRLTQNGRNKMNKILPTLKFSNLKWDKKWRILIFDIEERKRRDRSLLRSKLLTLGFKKIQKSVYISPYEIEKDLREYLEVYGYNEAAIIFIAVSESLEEAKKIAYRVWDLKTLENKYQKLLLKIRNQKLKTNKWIREIKTELIDLLLLDSNLPFDLLPDNWIRDRVVNEVRNLKV